MSERGKPSHWESLALELGAEIKPQSSQPAPPPAVPARPPVTERARSQVPTQKSQTDWSQLASELGLEVSPAPSTPTPRARRPEPVLPPSTPGAPPIAPTPPAARTAPPPARPAPPAEAPVRKPRPARPSLRSEPLEEIGEGEAFEAPSRMEPAEVRERPAEVRERPARQEDEGSERGPRRRRRRRGRKDGDAPQADAPRRDHRRLPREADEPGPLEDLDERFTDEFGDEDGLTLPLEDAEDELAEADADAEPEAGTAAEEARPKRRRRRRGGARKRRDRESTTDTPEETGAEPARATHVAKRAEKPSDSDDLDQDDDLDTDDDAKEELKGHRHIPSWDDAIDHIIATNMESRAKNPSSSSGAPRGRGGRGGHRGRGRSSGS